MAKRGPKKGIRDPPKIKNQWKKQWVKIAQQRFSQYHSFVKPTSLEGGKGPSKIIVTFIKTLPYNSSRVYLLHIPHCVRFLYMSLFSTWMQLPWNKNSV